MLNDTEIVIMGGANGNIILNDVVIFDTLKQETRTVISNYNISFDCANQTVQVRKGLVLSLVYDDDDQLRLMRYTQATNALKTVELFN